MDRIAQYRDIVERVLTEALEFMGPANDQGVEYKLMFDRQRDSYAITAIGFDGPRRVHRFVIHLEIINGKVWLQADNTDLVIARDLERAGILKNEIVLGFQEPEVRPYTEYAAA
ncbi:MAG: XisI protein [Acidobacteriota bacterium]